MEKDSFPEIKNTQTTPFYTIRSSGTAFANNTITKKSLLKKENYATAKPFDLHFFNQSKRQKK
jgi:hypothetical protein